jgi:mannose-1-phosphate guanylyltransferase
VEGSTTHPDTHLWVVILAAGEGLRVKHLTRDRRGRPAPKQYSSIDGRTTLIENTLARAKRIAPPGRIVAVVAEHHRRWWRSELAELGPRNLIVQPENRGTAAGILLPVLRITGRDPHARLLILPSDHAVASEDTLHDAVVDAASYAPSADSEIVLLGVRPRRPETGYGWIVPRPTSNDGPLAVARFREKPDPVGAAALHEQGGLLNSMILIAGGARLRVLFERETPLLWHSLRPTTDDDVENALAGANLGDVYRSVPTLDFSRDLLERLAGQLWVYPVPECGWLDIGTPDRLAGHLTSRNRRPRGRRRPNVESRAVRRDNLCGPPG